MNRHEIEEVFKTDKNDRFVHLVIPLLGENPEVHLSGKARLELTLDEVIRVKKYADALYANMTE